MTKKQHELLVFINGRLQDTGICPSFDEMKDALELKSKSGIHRLITGLEERGFVRRLPHRARALEILRLADSTSASPPPASAPGASRGALTAARPGAPAPPPEKPWNVFVQARFQKAV